MVRRGSVETRSLKNVDLQVKKTPQITLFFQLSIRLFLSFIRVLEHLSNLTVSNSIILCSRPLKYDVGYVMYVTLYIKYIKCNSLWSVILF